MPKWEPASDAWVSAFDKATADAAGVQRRKMFGYTAAFVNGKMAAGLHEVGLVLRLGAADREALLAKGGKPFEPMPGRVMGDFVVAPAALADRPAELKRWLQRSYEHAESLPAKKKKKKQ
jgi:TfoX/Sxy family transcriptional regulator of competence genes